MQSLAALRTTCVAKVGLWCQDKTQRLQTSLILSYDWASGRVYSHHLTFTLRFDSHGRSFASNIEQVASLLRAQFNSASYPQRDGKWVVAYGLREKA